MCGTATATCALLCLLPALCCLLSVQGEAAKNMVRPGQGLPQHNDMQMRTLRAKAGPRLASGAQVVVTAALQQMAAGTAGTLPRTSNNTFGTHTTASITVLLRWASKRHQYL
jgi:hypothetical protein